MGDDNIAALVDSVALLPRLTDVQLLALRDKLLAEVRRRIETKSRLEAVLRDAKTRTGT